MEKPRRNDLCGCGSGKKYKQCCQPKTGQAGSAGIPVLMQQALVHHRCGQLDTAQALYRQVLALSRAEPDAWHLLGLIYQSRGELTQALECLEQAVRIKPDNAAYNLNLGLAWQTAGKPDLAAARYRQVIAAQPDQAAAYNNLGNALKDLGQFNDALASYRAALALQRDPVILYNLANVLLELDSVTEALSHYREAVQLRPDYVEAHNNLGSALQGIGKHEEALACYRRAIEVRADFADAHNNLGNVLKDLGRMDEAQGSYRTALKLRPHVPALYNNLAHVLKAQGQIDAAKEAYARAIALDPTHVEAMTSLAGILQAQGDAAGAIAWYERVLQQKPDSLEVLNNLGCARHAAGQVEAAVACFEQAIASHPQSAEAHYNLGSVRQDLWQLEQAVACYVTALQLRPDYFEAHNNLGNACKALGRYDEAETSYLRALELAPRTVQAQTHCNLAILYSTQKRYALAEPAYRQALELEPGMVVAQRNLAAILANDGREAEARVLMDCAYRKKSWFLEQRHGVARTVLILLGVEKGNVPFAHLLPPERNNTVEWVIEYATQVPDPGLPDYDVVFNALGEPDKLGKSAEAVARFVTACHRPVLNPPAAVARTSRDHMRALFGEMGDIELPPIWRISVQQPAPQEVRWPVLARPTGTHGGEGMCLLEDAAALQQHLAAHPEQDFYAAPFYDYRSPDGYYRKYRMIFVAGIPYPYHLAISSHWMVHYATADMLHDWKLAEEQRFLADPAQVLGERGMAAVSALGQRLGLDYGGADFSLLPDGRILLFEANATMLVHPEKDEPRLMFKNPYVEQIYAAFDALVARVVKRDA